MSTMWTAGIVIVVASVLGALIGSSHLRNRKKGKFRGREPLSPDQFYERFFGNSGLSKVAVTAVRGEIAHYLELPEALLRPTDRFDFELAPDRGWAEWDRGLDLVRQRGILVSGIPINVNWSEVVTLDDLVKAVARSAHEQRIPT